MIGDVADFVSRMRRVLPAGWFGDVAPGLDAVLAGFSEAWSAIYDLIETVRAQTRLATATGLFVDMFSADFFGVLLPRWSGESDGAYKGRIGQALLRPKCTRLALISALVELTGQPVTAFEPARAADTGGYCVGGVGYGAGGAWGNLNLPFQSFVTVLRPHGSGIAQLAGYGTGGIDAYGNLSMVATQVSDADIYATAADISPIGYTVWVKITG